MQIIGREQELPRHNTWLGLSFERLCFAHIYAVQKALGITGVATKTFPMQKQVLVTLVSNQIPKKNIYYNSLITNNITLSDLFLE